MNINELIYERKKDFSDYKEKTYSEVLSFVRDYINKKYRDELAGDITKDIAKDRYKILIQQVIHDNDIFINDYTENVLIELLYNSMAKFDFLTPYLESNCGNLPDNPLYYSWEEINANCFDDIEVIVEGKYIKLEKGFTSPNDAVDIVKRLARMGGLNLDTSKCRGHSYIGNGIRIQVSMPPTIDEEAGVCFSIRRQKPSTKYKEFFIENDTATEDELDFLLMCLNNKASIGFAGGTGSGKTTDIGYLLYNVDESNRIYTIEDVREWNLVKKNENGGYKSRVVHTVTRESEDETLTITLDDLVKDALRYHPDIIALNEMRSKEAKSTIEMGGTDHTIISGLHAGGQRSAYRRITSLYMDAGTSLPENKVYENIVEAMPIMVHKKAFRSGERRYMSISEAYIEYNGTHAEIKFNKIYRFVVEGFERDKDGKLLKVNGKHKKVGNISNSLAQKLFENGVDLDIIRKYASPEFVPGRETDSCY